MKNFKRILVILFFLSSTNILSKLRKNTVAPNFKLNEVVTGQEFNLTSFKNKIVVLEWHSPLCPFSSRHANEGTMNKLHNKFLSRNVEWFGIDSSSSDYGLMQYSGWKSNKGINYPILRDKTGKIRREYGANVTPHMVIIKNGRVIYQGAFDDDTFGDQLYTKRKNYIEQALSSLVKTGELPKKFRAYNAPYGCGIK